MKALQTIIAMFLSAAVVTVTGCASPNHTNPNSRSEISSPNPRGYSNSNYGVIESIETIRTSNNDIGAGTVIGGVVGGVLGNQVGQGSGNTAATAAGAVGGAIVGHEIEKRNRTQEAYRIRVRLDSGYYQTVMQDSINDMRVGDRVRLENDRVSRYYR